MCLRLIVGLSLILHVSEINGVLTGASGPVLACHVPLEVKIFADSSYQALSADLKSCTQITLSSVNALFLPSNNTSLASILVSEKRSLELLKQQTPEAEFSFSLRSSQTSPVTWNLKTIFNRTTSVAQLVDFLRVNKLKSFDIAWDLIQSAPDYEPQLKSLKATLGREGFNLTTTIGVEVERIDAFHVTKISSIVDRIFLVSSYNRHYSGNQYPLTEKKVQQAFDALEQNEGAFLKLYSTLNLSWKKIVVGLSLQTLVWKLSLGNIVGTQFNQYQAFLQLQSYYESCKTVNSTWRLQQQPSPFYQLAVAPTNDQWMIHVDRLTLGKRVDLLRQYGFGGVALYDYYQDDFAGICSSKGKIYPLIQQVGQSIRKSSLAVPFPDVDINNGLCIPFLGLTNDCKGAFNFGTPKISIKSVEFSNTSSSSTIMVTRTILPVVNDAISTRVPSQYTAESVAKPSSSTTEATDVLGPSWALMSDDDNLIRTRRSSLSSGELLGTEPSYSYLKPPGFDLFDITPRIFSSISKVELPALKSLTTATVSPDVVTEASNVKVELSHQYQTNSSGSVSTTLSPTLQLPETGGYQAAFQESQLSTTDIVSSKSLPLKSEIPTTVESGSAVSATSLPELGAVTETVQAVTHLLNAIESDAPVAPLSLSNSEIDRTMDFPIISTVLSLLEAGIDPSLRKIETTINFDPKNEATTDVITYASDTREYMTDFLDRISTENPMVDVTVSPDENYIFPTAEQPASVLANNENTVAPAEVESDLENISTTRPSALTEQESIASIQYSDFVTDLLEQTTSDVSSLSTGDHLESSTMVPVYSDAFDTTGTKYEAPLLQDFALASIQLTDDDETASSSSEMTSSEPDWSTIKQPINQPEETFPSEWPLTFSSSLSIMQPSSSEISIESPVTTLSSQALFSSTATETFTEDSPVSDVYSASILPFDLVDGPSTSAMSTEEQERRLDLNSASSLPNEETESTSNMDFSTQYDSSLLEVDAQVHSENDIPSENSFSVVTSSVPEWSSSEKTFGSETHVLHSTVFDASLGEDYHSEYQGVIGTDYPGTIFDNQLATVEEGSAESSLASTVLLPTLEPYVPPVLMDVVSTSLIPDLAEMSTGPSSNSPAGSATPIEEKSFSTRIDSSTAETPTLLDASIAAIELADSDFTASDKNSLFGKPQLETTSMSTITDSNKIQFTEPSKEDSSDESTSPYSTRSTGDEMTDIPTGYEVKSSISSLQTDEETVSDEFLPTTSQTSTETSLPTSELDEVPPTLESLSPFTVTDTSSTFLKPIIMESSTKWQHFESSSTNLKMDIEEIQSPNDLSTPYSSTVLEITGTDTFASFSDTNLSLEIADSEVTSPAPDWNSDEVFTQSEFLSSASIDVEMTKGPAVNKDDMSAVSTTTFLDEQLTMSELSSVPMKTSTDIHFSPSVSNEFHPTFEPTLPPNLEGDLVASMEDIQPTNAIDLSTSTSAILPDITTATSSIHWEDSQSNLPIEGVVSSDTPFAVDEINNFDTTHLMEISEPTSVPTSSPEDGSHSTVKEDFPNSLFVSFEQTSNPIESNPSSLMSESANDEWIATDPPLLYSTSTNVEITSSSEGYMGEMSTSLAVMSSDEQFTPVDLSPSNAGTIAEGSSSMLDEFSGTSELPFNLADTSTFPVELSTSHLNFVSGKPLTFLEDAQAFTMEELSSSLLPILPESTTPGTMLVDDEDDPFLSTTSRLLEDSQSNMPIEETFSTLIPFDTSYSSDGSFEESLVPLETNPLVSMTDSSSSTSFESLGASHELSKDFTSFESSPSTANPPISDEFQLLDTDVTTSDEEIVDHSIQTAIFENEGSGGNSLVSLDNDGSGSPGVLFATNQPFETFSIPVTSVTINPINWFSSPLTDELLEHVDDPFTNDVAFSLSTETNGTFESSIISDVFSTDETFETSSPNVASAELILDTTTFASSLSRLSTPRPIIDVGTVYSVPITDDNTMAGSGDQLWDNTLSEDASVSLTGSLEDTISTDPPLPYTLVNMDVVSSLEGYNGEISIASAATSSEEQFSIGKFSPNVAVTSTEGSSSTFDEFSGTSELPFDVTDATAFFNPTELSTSPLNFLSGNSVTFSGDTPTLTEEEPTSSGSPILGETSTSVFELTDEEENHISHTTSLDLKDSHPTVPPEENLFSPIPFDTSVSPSGFEQTVTPLQTNPLLVVTDSLTITPLDSVGTSKKLSEDLASFSPSIAEAMFSEFQLLGTDFTTADEGVIEVSTMASTFETENWTVLLEEDGSGATPGFLNATAQPSQNENSIVILEQDGSGTTPGFLNATAQPNPNENWIVILEEDGSGAVTPGFLNATDQPSQTTDSTSEIELTISGVHLSFSSPTTSIAEPYETGTVTSSVESTSIRGFSDNVTGQDLLRDSFETTTIGFSGTMDLSSFPGSPTEMSIALTSPPTTDISTTGNPSSTTHLPINLTGSAESQSTFDITTSMPPLPPNVPPVSSPDPVFDMVTVSFKPPSAYYMMASSTERWYHTPTENSGSLVSSGSSRDLLLLLPTSTTEIQTTSTSINSFPVTPETLLTSSVPTVELSTPSSSTTTYSLTPPSLLSSTLMHLTTSPDAVPSPSTSSASPTSISPNFSDISASTTVPPIINLWNLLMSRITTADGILSSTKNSTSGSLLSDGTTFGLINEELKGSSTSSMSSTTGNSENSAFVTLPFWLVTRPSPDSSTVFSTGQALSQETTPTAVAIFHTTTRNTKVPVRSSTMASATQSAADLFVTRPVWFQGNTKPSKLTSNVLTSTRLSTTTISSTEGKDSIIVTYSHKPSKSNELSALHTFPSASTTTPLLTSSTELHLLTNVNPMVNGHPYVRNCTEHVMNPSSSVSSVTNVVTNDVQVNVTAGMGDKKQNFSFHLEKLSEALNLLVASYPEIKEEEIQPSAICKAARDSILLKSLFCLNQSPSAMKEKRIPNVIQLIRHLAPAIIANLTAGMNLEVKDSANGTGFEIDGSSVTPSTAESTIPMSTERTTRSKILTQHSTESFLLNLSTTLLSNVSMSRLPTVLNISLESLMENLSEQLKETQLTDVISAVNRLSHDVPAGFLESLIQNNSSEVVYFSETVKVEGVKEEMISTEEHTSTSSTTKPTTEVHDVLQMDFWKTNRRNPVKMLQRKARTGVGSLPTIGRYWRDTTKSISNLFRPFAKPAMARS